MALALSPSLTSYAPTSALTLPESKPILMTSGRRGLFPAASERGALALRLAASGFTLYGSLNIRNLSESDDDAMVILEDLDIADAKSCVSPGAKCDAGYDKMDLTLWCREPVMEHHRHKRFHHEPFGPQPVKMAATPEPMSMLLFGTGLLVLGGTLRRRRRAASIQHL